MAYIFGSIWDRFNRNALNALSKSVEQQGKSIQDLVAEGQLTPTQYATLIETINGMISKGELSFEDIDINKGKLLPKHISEEVLKMIVGDAPVNAVPADGSLTTEKYADGSITLGKTNFVKKTGNLFDGEYSRVVMGETFDRTIAYRLGRDAENVSTAIVKIQPGKTYNVKVFDGHTSFLMGVTNAIPTPGLEYKNTDTPINFNVNLNEFSFKNTTTGNYLMIYLSNIGQRPKLVVQENDEITSYIPANIIDSAYVETPSINLNNLSFSKSSDKNIFDGQYKKGAAELSFDGLYKYRASQNENENIVVEKVEPSTTYTIKIHEPGESNRFVIGGMINEPVFGVWKNLDYGFNADNSLSEYTLTTPGDMRYIIVYVSNEGKEPLLQIEKGATATEYQANQFIPRRFLEIPSNESVLPSRNSFGFYGGIPHDYNRPSGLTGVRSGDAVNITITDIDFIYGLYDNLMTEYPENISKRLLGYGSSSVGAEDKTLPIYEYTFDPNFPDHGSVEIPRLLVTSSVHGNEKLAVWSTFKYFEGILNGDDEYSNFFKRSIEYRVIPLVNPGGYNDNTRFTKNNVNINRNFKPSWSSAQQNPGTAPLSERESILLDNWFVEFKNNAIAYIDVHNIDGIRTTSQGRYGFLWMIAPSKIMQTISMHMISALSKKWKTDLPGFSRFSRDIMLGETTDYHGGMAMEQAYRIHGIPSVVIDGERGGGGVYPDIIANNEALVKLNVDSMGATVLSIIDNIAK